MFRHFATFAALVTLSGCASTIGTFLNRPVVEDNVHDTLSTMSLAADRRTIIIKTTGDDKGRFCAEPPPDTATNLKTELEASLEAKAKLEKAKADLAGEFGLKDKLEASVVVIAERTAALDAFRTGVYALCQFHLNGAIADGSVPEMFKRLIQSFETNHAFSKHQGGEVKK